VLALAGRLDHMVGSDLLSVRKSLVAAIEPIDRLLPGAATGLSAAAGVGQKEVSFRVSAQPKRVR
jgi:hypothetical protein